MFQLDKSGCASETMSLAEFALNKFSYSDRFELNAELEEDGTGWLPKISVSFCTPVSTRM